MTLSSRLSGMTSWRLLYLKQYMINTYTTYKIKIEMRLGMWVSSEPDPICFNPGVVVDVVDLMVQLQHL